MNYRMISYILGCILLFEAAFMTVPIITALVYSETAVVSFAITLVICAAVGGLLMLTKPRNFKIYSREGYVIVSLSWIVLSVFGAIPLMLSGAIPSFIDALFETVSGFTTTGATILTEVESLPKSVLMWRSFTHWIGGMGVLVFMMAFLPLCGGQNMHIMKA
ncbi:MAG: TrkH family potassium uptake protein, partial [Oscillospiraceae bacterium]|nr:TrkH family potassium uptake protein [Oscillospiraceae bacterium]